MAKLIANFLHLNLNDEDIHEAIKSKNSYVLNMSHELKNGMNQTISIGKFHGVLGDWVNYFSMEQAKMVDDMIKLKFESQNLKMTADTSVALKRLENYGRFMVFEQNEKKKLWTTNMNSDYSLLSLRSRSKTPFRKKPVFTKDEAIFIRKKDKVVIIEERVDCEINKPNWLIRVFRGMFACCFPTKAGYTPF